MGEVYKSELIGMQNTGGGDLSGYLPLDGTSAMTGDLNTDGNNIAMGAGLIGYDGTASEGLSFDTAGNVTVEGAGKNFDINGNNLVIDADGDSKIYANADDQIVMNLGGNDKYYFYSTYLYIGSSSNFPKIEVAAATATNPVYTFNTDEDTGLGLVGADNPCIIAGGTTAVSFTTTAMTLYVGVVDYGADDSGGVGYKVLRVPN